jgi:site-specific recombinase XerD
MSTDLEIFDSARTLELPTAPLADAVRAKLIADLGRVQVGRDGQDRIYRNRIDLLAEALTPETFVIAVDWLTSTRRGSVATKRAYADDLRNVWAPYVAECGLGDRLALDILTADHIRAWRIREEASGVSRTTIGRRLNALSSLHRYAAERVEGLGLNPITQDDRPQIDKRNSSTSTPVLETGELQAVIAAAADDRDALIVSLLYTLAGRVSELCAADVTDRIERGRRSYLDVTRKEHKQRILPLPLPVAELLDRHTAGRTEGPLLLDSVGNRLDRHDVARLLGRLGRRAGVLPGRRLTPHVLRASRITHMLDAEVPLAEVQQFADHDNPATTVGYWERRNKDQRNVQHVDDGAALLDGLLDRWLGGNA